MMHLVRRLWPSRSSLSSCRHLSSGRVPPPCLDLSYLSNPANRDQILDNVAQRERPIQELDKILDRLQQGAKEPDPELVRDLCQIPNRSHPDVASYGREPRLIKARPWTSRILPKAEAEEKEPKLVNFISLAKAHQGLRTQDLNHLCGERTYYFSKALADLEQALVMYSVDRLTQEFGFELVSVPDLLHPDILEACGMDLHKGRTQVFQLDPDEYGPVALSGTAEMALGGYFMNKVVEKPRKLAAVSRCYRAETSNLKHEKGIFRVHQFTKVEMFGVLPSGEVEASNALLEEFLAIQDRLFGDLNLGYSILDMPAHELGNPAYRKYDIEAEFPARGTRGEISSCSNCTDYQSRRLNIRGPTGEFCHTVNGTACAVPRMIMALVEQGQDQDKRIFVPEVLRQYMSGLKELIPPNKKNTLMFAFRLSPHYFWTRRTKQKKKSSTAASASKSN